MGCDISLSVPKIRDMDAIRRCILTYHTTWYGIWYHRLSRYFMRYHTGSPQNTLLWPTFCSGSLSLHSSWLVFRLAFFVVLLLPIRWTHHRTDRTTSEHHLLTTRPAIWVHDCFCSVFLFLLSLSPFLLYTSQKCSRYWYRYLPKMWKNRMIYREI